MNLSEKLKKRIWYFNPVEVDEGSVDVNKIIRDLINTPASSKNEDQGKFVSLLKGIAFSDNPISDEFMQKLMKMVSEDNFGDLLK